MSNVKIQPLVNGQAGGGAVVVYRVVAVLASVFSLLTTVWAVEWVWPDGNPLHRWLAAGLVELIFFALKLTLFNGSSADDSLGWIGFILDTITNMGGILPRASAVITFPPFALVFSLFTVYDELTSQAARVNGAAITWGGIPVALIGAVILSVAPFYLWKRKR